MCRHEHFDLVPTGIIPSETLMQHEYEPAAY